MLQEWTDDLGQMEDKHRHFSHLYGLYPGNVISARSYARIDRTGYESTGTTRRRWHRFSRGWKMALWARLHDGDRANRIFKGYLKEQCYASLFAKCFTPLQVDGTLWGNGRHHGNAHSVARRHD
jgi:alpha-L-fucosidase 2